MKANRSELAIVFGVSETTITKWTKDGMPREQAKGTAGSVYSTGDCIRWFANREKSKLVASVDGSIFDLNTERARLAHHQANKTALEEKVLNGELIPAEEIKKAWGDAVMASRSKFLALPGKLAKVAINAESVKEVEREADRLVREALEEICIYD